MTYRIILASCAAAVATLAIGCAHEVKRPINAGTELKRQRAVNAQREIEITPLPEDAGAPAEAGSADSSAVAPPSPANNPR